MKNKKIFAVSDLHGHYKETINYLKDSGWDENNPNHLLVVCGDIFDRGSESLEIYLWLKPLTENGKAIVLKGNHEPFFIDFLEGSNDTFNYNNNGLKTTLDDFVHSTSDFQMFLALNQDKSDLDNIWNLWVEWCYNTRKLINEENPELLAWLKSLPYYYETENYIFTHGAIDGTCPDWHHPHKDLYGKFMDWEACAWDDGSFFGSSIVNTDKTVVVGHYGTESLRKMYNIKDYLKIHIPKNENDTSTSQEIQNAKYNILIRNDKRVIAIDGTTIVSKQVNVLVVEDNV